MRRFAAVLLLAAAALLPCGAAAAVASGCTTALPTFVGGRVTGYPDGRAVNTHLGVALTRADGRQVNPDGTLTSFATGGGYSWIEQLNPTVPGTGSTDPAATTTWGRCVAANVAEAFVEAGPFNTSGVADHSRYGSVAVYHIKVTAGARLNTLVRELTVFQVGGNTGGMQGYITYRGAYVPSSAVTRVRAFTTDGAGCGIHGIAASATALGSATGPNRTHYRIDFLAAGQCYAPYQTYSLQMTCHAVCGAADKNVAVLVNVARGVWPRVDVQF